MAIKSDRWIREMSEKHGMIEPYAENQVRFDENGEKLISYGVSSYGYDYAVPVNSRFLQTYILQLSIQRILMTKVLSILSLMFVLFRQTHLP